MKKLSVSFVFFFVCQNLWCGNSFKLAPLSRAIHPSSKLYQEKKTQLHPAGSTRNAFRLNLLTDRDDSFTTALNRAARSPNTEDISAYSELISPKSVALGSIGKNIEVFLQVQVELIVCHCVLQQHYQPVRYTGQC